MKTPSRPAPRWSKRVDQLVHDIAGSTRLGLQSELGRWMDGSARFQALVEAHQTKLRKKLESATGDDARLDVRAELLVAYLLLEDRRFEVAFETFGARRAGPDLTVTYRANLVFNLEVTRLRATDGHAQVSPDRVTMRLASVLAGKARQLPATSANAVVVLGEGFSAVAESLNAAARVLRTRLESKDDAYFARRGLRDGRQFRARYQHLAGVFVLDETALEQRVLFWPNVEARRALPAEAVQHVLACFGRPLA
jgi:hypothetical protein